MRPRSTLAALIASTLALTAWGWGNGEPKKWSGAVDLPGGQKLTFTVNLEATSGTITIPQQVTDKALDEVSVTPEKIFFLLKNPAGGAANAVFEFKPAADGNSADGVLKQMGREFKATLKPYTPGEAPKGSARPQDPRPPFPYTATEVTVKVGPTDTPTHTLSGTLTVPEGKGPFPAVVMVTGSGPQDRDEALMGHRPFLVIADHLTRHGVAVLRYDDRGVGKSTGDFATATTDDFVEDALAAVAFAKGRPEIDPKKVGIVGHSEGGLVAPMAAAKSPDPAFIVLLAGPGIPAPELLALQGRLIGEATGSPKDVAEANAKASLEVLGMFRDGKPETEIRERLVAALREIAPMTPEAKAMPKDELEKKIQEEADGQIAKIKSPWMLRFLRIDPADALAKVKVPVLALNGEKDLQVPPKENLAGIRAVFEKAGVRNATVRELPGLNHLFQNCKTGSPTEYATIEETFAPSALDAMTGWIRETTK